MLIVANQRFQLGFDPILLDFYAFDFDFGNDFLFFVNLTAQGQQLFEPDQGDKGQ